MKANAERMKKRIDTIASFTSEEGRITRLTFSQAWVDAIRYLKGEMEAMGMTVRMDSFGNVIGNFNPGHSTEKPIGIGSHIDSVVNAGAYDGVAGIVVGLELVNMMYDAGVIPKVPIEVLKVPSVSADILAAGI